MASGFKRAQPHQHNYDVEKYKHVYLPLQQQGWVAIANASDQGDIEAEDAITTVGPGSGAPSFGEVTDSGIVGLHMDAAGDDVGLVWPVAFDCDVKSKIEFRVHYSSASATASDTHTWKVLYTKVTPETTAVDAPATALSTAIAADTTKGTANVYQRSPWGILNGGTVENEDVLLLAVELDATDSTLASEELYGYFLEIRYVRRAI